MTTDRDQALQAILRDLVQDLEKIAAVQTCISLELRARNPQSLEKQKADLDIAAASHEKHYDKIRAKIDALPQEFPSESS